LISKVDKTLTSRLESGTFTGDFSAEGLFTNPVGWTILPSPELSKSDICFVYPGQGAMFPGMAKRFQEDPIFVDLFERADLLAETYGLPKISDYAFSPNRLTSEQQDNVESIALFIFELALTYRLVAVGYRPKVVTGHSFGEYAALVASGIWDFETGFECVAFRERALPEKNSAGYMIAIALPVTSVSAILGKIPFFISNINSSNQTVVSASWEFVSEIESILSSSSIKFKRLSSPQPFHSPLLAASAAKMKGFTPRQGWIHPVCTEVFSSVLKNYVSRISVTELEVKTIMEKQLLEPVDFPKQIGEIGQRCNQFIELGPRPFLIDLIKSNLKGEKFKVSCALDLIPQAQMSSPAKNIEKSQVSESILKKVNTVIARLTGYSVQNIKFEDKFQEDLGIDSIKTMEISIEVMNEFQLGKRLVDKAQDIRTVGELAYRIQNESALQERTAQKGDREGCFEVYVEQFRDQELSIVIESTEPEENEITIRLGSDLDFSFPDFIAKSPISRVFFICDTNPSAGDFAYASIKVINLFLKIQELIKTNKLTPRTQIAVMSETFSDPIAQTLSSFFKSLKKEKQLGFVIHIGFDSSDFDDVKKTVIARRELKNGVACDTRYFKGQRQTLQIEPIPPKELEVGSGTLVALGGAKGITAHIVRHLAQKGRWAIHLIGRTPEKDPRVMEAIGELKKYSHQVQYHQADGRNQKSVETVLEVISQSSKKIDLLVNGAGIELSKKFADKQKGEIEEEFSAKAEVAIALDKIFRKYPIEKAVLFSSVVSKYGNAGQSVYAAANAFSEWVWRGQEDSSSRCVIQWPPWDNVGMTEKPVILEILKSQGVSLLKKEKAGELFERSLEQGRSLVWDETDRLLYQGSLISTESLGLSSISTSVEQSELNFEFPFSTVEHEVLLDHSLNGIPILPIALTSYWFLKLGTLISGSPQELIGFGIVKPLVLTRETKKLSLNVKRSPEDPSAICISLLESGALVGQGLVRGALEKNILPTQTSFQIKEILNSKDFYSTDKLFHGPRFRFLNEVKVIGKDELRAKINFPEIETSLQFRGWNEMAIIDAGFQLLALAGLHFANWRGLPVGADKIHISDISDVRKGLTWHASNIQVSGNKLTGDLTLTDARERIVGRISQASFNWVQSFESR